MKYAFLVGNNDYPSSPLNGCIEDAKDFAQTLISTKVVTKKNVTVVVNATKDSILSGLKDLISKGKMGDLLIFYYSGHGSYVTDTHGDEKDKKDECLVPIDYDAAGFILDDEISAIINNLAPGAILEVFLDSCFSGTATRNPTTTVSRFLPPPTEVHGEVKKRVFRGKVDAKINHVLWAGCSDKQTSMELDVGGQVRGAFTYSICKELRVTGKSTKRSKLIDKVIQSVKNMGIKDQTPQLEGSRLKFDKNIFT